MGSAAGVDSGAAVLSRGSYDLAVPTVEEIHGKNNVESMIISSRGIIARTSRVLGQSHAIRNRERVTIKK